MRVGTLALAMWICTRAAAQVVHDPRFAHDTLYTGPGMVALAFAPDGRLYVCQKRGRVLMFAPDSAGGYAAPAVFLDLTSEVFFEMESGLLGIALDPNFSQNRYLYLYYTRAKDARLIRVTAGPGLDRAEPGSRLTLLDGLPRSVNYHKGGQLRFSPNDPQAIYLGIGDDEKPERAQDPDSYEGKILRINKTNGRGMADNPFYQGDLEAVRSRVWALGMRNPFRFVFHPQSRTADVVYLSENGDVKDRLSRVTRGSNGSRSKRGDQGGFLSPPDKGHRVLLTEPASLVGLAIDAGGAFADSTEHSVLLLSNGISGSVQRYRLLGAALDSVEPLDQGLPFLTGLSFAAAVDMAIGPDDALYYVHSAVDGSDKEPYLLGRVRRVSEGPPPTRLPGTEGPLETAPGGCDDLTAIPENPEVDYERDIQRLFSTQCVGCHIGMHGNLDLRAGSLKRLLSVPSTFVSAKVLIAPGAPERSYLFEKINCARPQHGMRMRPTGALSLAEQARVRDFIVQLTKSPVRPAKPIRIRKRWILAGAIGIAITAFFAVSFMRRWRRSRAPSP